MNEIVYRELASENIEVVRDMCERLMKFQADKAQIRTDVLASMNFENRFVPDFNAAFRKKVIVAYNGDTPAGFAFTTITDLTQSTINALPVWASDLGGIGFYPEDYEAPKRIGTFKLLFVDSAYRGLDIGKHLSDLSMDWLKSNDDVDDLWVFVANGNEQVGRFYEKYGFKFSHAVFNGFIGAYRQKIQRVFTVEKA